ncbi:ABC transporter substrate-binding protein [Kribbella italica]|uniref:Multiple sugar transport system substrate-binding protein n=1 Tax=Kribbella italica TaxID=1540520 RepID=A0A7W9J4Z0_9ACTN|nr:ABC transporter substrate-binding protein [Kribbella italica]MBB5835736.1 multiple sugar transport system substrate-binding protein [Kribbella italica]
MRSRSLLLPAAGLAVAVLAASCVGAVDTGKSSSGTNTITVWNGYSGRELDVFKSVVKDFEAANPGVSVTVVGQQNNDKLVQGLRGGSAPDVQWAASNDYVGLFCSSGGWIDLTDRIAKDGLDTGQFTPASWQATQYDGKRCALPALGDVYGLYYNKKLFAQAGLKTPPKTFQQLTEYARKLTKRSPDGKLEVAGYLPLTNFYANRVQFYAPFFGAEWFDADGKPATAASPGWKAYLGWQRDLVGSYGYEQAKAFTAAAGQPYSAANAFQQGKLAMMIDGEYRTAFIKQFTPDLDFGTAPMPVTEQKAADYGMGYVVNHIAGVTKASKNPDLAWKLVKYLATDEQAQVKLGNGLVNVPTWKPALASKDLVADPAFKSFVAMQVHPASQTNPTTAAGAGYIDPMSSFLEQWESGRSADPAAGLAKVDEQITGLLGQR